MTGAQLGRGSQSSERRRRRRSTVAPPCIPVPTGGRFRHQIFRSSGTDRQHALTVRLQRAPLSTAGGRSRPPASRLPRNAMYLMEPSPRFAAHPACAWAAMVSAPLSWASPGLEMALAHFPTQPRRRSDRAPAWRQPPQTGLSPPPPLPPAACAASKAHPAEQSAAHLAASGSSGSSSSSHGAACGPRGHPAAGGQRV